MQSAATSASENKSGDVVPKNGVSTFGVTLPGVQRSALLRASSTTLHHDDYFLLRDARGDLGRETMQPFASQSNSEVEISFTDSLGMFPRSHVHVVAPSLSLGL